MLNFATHFSIFHNCKIYNIYIYRSYMSSNSEVLRRLMSWIGARRTGIYVFLESFEPYCIHLLKKFHLSLFIYSYLACLFKCCFPSFLLIYALIIIYFRWNSVLCKKKKKYVGNNFVLVWLHFIKTIQQKGDLNWTQVTIAWTVHKKLINISGLSVC